MAYDAIAHAACDRRVAEQAARKEAIRNGDTESRRPSSCRRSRAATRRDAPRPTWRCLKPRRRARRSSKRRRARWRAAQRAAPTCPARGAGGAPLGQLRLVRPRRARKTRADHACTFQGRVWGVCVLTVRTALYGFNVLRTPFYGFNAYLYVYDYFTYRRTYGTTSIAAASPVPRRAVPVPCRVSHTARRPLYGFTALPRIPLSPLLSSSFYRKV